MISLMFSFAVLIVGYLVYGRVADQMFAPDGRKSVVGGGVHDYMCGMISERREGVSIAKLSGIYIGNGAKWKGKGQE